MNHRLTQPLTPSFVSPFGESCSGRIPSCRTTYGGQHDRRRMNHIGAGHTYRTSLSYRIVSGISPRSKASDICICASILIPTTHRYQMYAMPTKTPVYAPKYVSKTDDLGQKGLSPCHRGDYEIKEGAGCPQLQFR
jgi:hypothetical protein